MSHVAMMSVRNRWLPLLCVAGSLALILWAIGSTKIESELLLLDQLRAAHQRLKDDSRNVQGTFRRYRTESAVPAVLDAGTGEPSMPLVMSGQIWRQGDTVRVDYVTFTSSKWDGDRAQECRHALAIDAKSIYELSELVPASGEASASGALTIYQRGSSEAAELLRFLDLDFLQPLDVLWRAPGTDYVDLLQSSGASVLVDPAESVSGGTVFRVVQEDQSGVANIGLFEFEGRAGLPLRRITSTAKFRGGIWTLEQRVSSVKVGDLRLPNRIVEVSSVGLGTGWTEVVEFDLRALDRDSAPARALAQLSPESFRDFGVDYQVFRNGEGGIRVPGER